MRKRNTKIVATLGPASTNAQTLQELIETGMDVARLNFSHGEHIDHAEACKLIRETSAKLGKPVSILQDLQGPKIRTARIQDNGVKVYSQKMVKLTIQPILGTEDIIPIDFPLPLEHLIPGTRILLDDGKIELKVVKSGRETIETKVIVGGEIKPHKGVNIPGLPLHIPGFTSKDRRDLEFGLSMGVDYVAISFVRTSEDIQLVRSTIESLNPGRARIPLIAKLERPEALQHLDEIIQCTDGVMVARGDLGVELPPEEVPIVQKEIIHRANRAAKIVITATQMLESMIYSPRPTRAEASDVANAIFDGSDAVMLSGETAVGSYPVKTVEMMNAIICQAEEHNADWGKITMVDIPEKENDDAYYVCRAASEMAKDRNVALIVVFTQSGRTARYMSKTRPGVRIIAFTPEPATYQKLGLYWGITPVLSPYVESVEAVIKVVEEKLLAWGQVEAGQQLVLLCGFPIQTHQRTNLALLHTVGI